MQRFGSDYENFKNYWRREKHRSHKRYGKQNDSVQIKRTLILQSFTHQSVESIESPNPGVSTTVSLSLIPWSSISKYLFSSLTVLLTADKSERNRQTHFNWKNRISHTRTPAPWINTRISLMRTELQGITRHPQEMQLCEFQTFRKTTLQIRTHNFQFDNVQHHPSPSEQRRISKKVSSSQAACLHGLRGN